MYMYFHMYLKFKATIEKVLTILEYLQANLSISFLNFKEVVTVPLVINISWWIVLCQLIKKKNINTILNNLNMDG